MVSGRVARLIWVAGLLLSASLVAGVYFDRPTEFFVSETEARTAVTTRYMEAEGVRPFTYATPILGVNWEIPSEFPLYQMVVSGFARGEEGVAGTGRLVSLSLLAVAIIVACGVLRATGLSEAQVDTFMSLAVTSPILLTYSVAFTSGTTVLLLCLLYLYGFAQMMKTERFVWLLVALSAGVLAAVVSPTSWVVFALVIAMISAWSAWTEIRRRAFALRRIFESIGLLFVPLAAGWLWILRADHVKQGNPFGRALASGATLGETFGSWAQKVSIVDWSLFFSRSCLLLVGFAGLVIPLLLLQGREERDRDPYHLRLGAIFSVAFLIGPVIFTGTYLADDGQLVATGVLVLFAIAIAAGKGGLSRASLIVLVAGNLLMSWVWLELKTASSDDPLNRHIVQAIDRLPREASIIVFGAYLDAEIPYHTGLKALQTCVEDFDDPVFAEALEGMTEANVGAVVTKGAQYSGIAKKTAARLGLDVRRELGPGVILYGKRTLGSRFRTQRFNLKKEIDDRVGGFVGRFNAENSRLIMSVELRRGPAVLVAAKGSLYLFDPEGGFRVVHRRWASELVESPRLEIQER